MTEKRRDICREYEKAGMKPEIIRRVAVITKFTDDDVSLILNIIYQNGQNAANVQKMLDRGIPMALIIQLFPYFEQPDNEVIEIRREKFGM